MSAIAFDAAKQTLRLPRWLPVALVLVVGYGVIPIFGTSYLFEAILLPFLALSMLAFFLLALGCIGRLDDSRPEPRRLTSFYLYVALGGAIGGAFAAFVAPLVFDSIVEYPLAIVLSLLLLPYGARETPANEVLRDSRWRNTPGAISSNPAEQPGQGSSQDGSNMTCWTISWLRPPNICVSPTVPPGPSNA